MYSPAEAVGTYPFEWKGRVYQIPDDICITPYFRSIFDLLVAAAQSEFPVLVLGAPGTGKDVIARLIHALAGRLPETFKAFNCAGKTPGTIESELFGHRRGAWTGASEAHGGMAEAAGTGTLFLDEVADHPLEVQGLLLRFLQNRTWYRMGETQERRFHGAVIAATNKDLEELVKVGKFRKDLFDRLKARRIQAKDLEDRPADIVPLFRHLARVREKKMGGLIRFSDEALALLRRYTFPENVRELEHIFSNVVIDASGRPVTPRFIKPYFHVDPGPPRSSPVFPSVKAMRSVMQTCGENRSLEARKLGMPRTSWLRKRKRALSAMPSP